jgi:DNA-binding CsgD family transcriptional regulator
MNPHHAQPLRRLSLQQRRVLEGATMGLTDKQIAERLGLSVHTVDSHWRHIRRKLGVPNRAAAVAAWLTGGRPAGGGGHRVSGFPRRWTHPLGAGRGMSGTTEKRDLRFLSPHVCF